MVALNTTFDATAVEPSAPRDIIPPGDYIAQIVESEMADTKRGDGQMLKLTLDIIDGPHAGRKLWDRLNIVNPNQTAVEIAQRTLSAICHAVGQLTVTDSEQLHFKPLVVTVKVRPAGPDKSGVDREAQNEISGYKAAGGRAASTAAPARQAAPAPTQAKPATASPPWRRPA